MKSILKRVLAVVMALILVIPYMYKENVYADEYEVTEMPSGSAILGNSAEDYVPVDSGEGYDISQYEVEENISANNSNFKTKKGLQGANLIESQYSDLGVRHTLFNVSLDYIVSSKNEDPDTQYEYNGKTYYFNYIPGLWPPTVHQYNAAGWDVSIVLLLGKTEPNMIYSGARGATNSPYCAWNLDDAQTVELYEAVFNFLADTYGYNADPEWSCFIKNWIIGNEVNMPNAYNYTGTMDLNTNVKLYARQFKLANEIFKSHNPDMKTYISLDHSWTHNDEGNGFAGKEFLNAFSKEIARIAPGQEWNIAYHPYAAIMTNSNIWQSGYTTKDENTQFISGYNLDVLTKYVKKNFGTNVRIILSEQGFTVTGGQYNQQAASLAYTYYMAEFDDMIDAVIFRALRDTAAETAYGFQFGLLNADDSKRPSYNVFKYMDTEKWNSVTSSCLSTMGQSSWSNIVPNFNANKFLYIPLKEINFASSSMNVPQGYQRQLKYTLSPSNTSETKLTWTSSDENVASVDANGLVTAKAVGTATITASGQNVSASCTIVVSSDEEVRAGVEGFVNRMYTVALGRGADSAGLEFWVNELMTANRDGAAVAKGFVLSPEMERQNLSNEEFVVRLYQTFFNRTPAEGDSGKAFWLNLLEHGVTRAYVFRGFCHSNEFTALCSNYGITRGSITLTENRDKNHNVTMYVYRCYKETLGRTPDAKGMNFWTGAINNKQRTPIDVAGNFVFSSEFKNKNLSDSEYVKVLYRMFFGREYDQKGYDFWMGELTSGRRDRYKVFTQFANSAEFKAILAQFGL